MRRRISLREAGIVGKSVDTEPGDRLRVLVVDGDPLARRMIRDALGLAGILIVWEAADEQDVLPAARHYKPDVILLDVVGSSFDELAGLQQLVADANVTAKVVILSARDQLELGHVALRMGAVGYLHKDLDPAVLPRVLRDVADGGAAVSRGFTADLVRRLRDVPEGGIGMRPVHSVLTTREWEIVDQLSIGRSTDQIADAFVISQETVRTHVKNIQRKLDVHTRDGVVDFVRRLRMGIPSARAAMDHPHGPPKLSIARDWGPQEEDHGPTRAGREHGPDPAGGTLAEIGALRARRAASVSDAGYPVAASAVTQTGVVQSVQIGPRGSGSDSPSRPWRSRTATAPRRADRRPGRRHERAGGIGA